MGGATLPTPSTPGYTSFRGRTTCDCLAKWLPAYERLAIAKGMIQFNLDIWQLTGGAPASGGTHTKGGAFDLLYQTGPAFVALAREMGALGTWGRTKSQGFTADHLHGVLYSCPHNGPAAYQIAAMRRGYNGLGVATSGQYAGMWGYGGRDTYSQPTAIRSWEQGIAWAESQIAAIAPPKQSGGQSAPINTPAPTGGLSMADIDSITAQLASIDQQVKGLRSEESGRYVVYAGRHQWLTGALAGIGRKVGVEVDEGAIATAVVDAITPTVRDAVVAAGQTEAVADAVVAKLGSALNPVKP